MRLRRLVGGEHTTDQRRQLKMRWTVVIERGKRQLRMDWTKISRTAHPEPVVRVAWAVLQDVDLCFRSKEDEFGPRNIAPVTAHATREERTESDE